MDDSGNSIYHKLSLLSSILGANPLLVQGGGGNVSIKDGETLFVKASGFWLSCAMEEDIFLPVDIPLVIERIRAGIETLSDLGSKAKRPSIETPLHALMPQKIVVHLHMLDAIIYSAIKDAEGILQEKLKGLKWGMAPYARPGLPLCRIIDSVCNKPENIPNILMLKNHGIIIGAEHEEELISMINDLVIRLSLIPRPVSVPDVFTLVACNDISWNIPSNPLVHASAFGKVAGAITGALPLYPDHVVFLGAAIPVLDSGEKLSAAIDDFQKTFSMQPLFAIVKECGVLVHPQITSGAFAMLEALGNVCLRAPEGIELQRLSCEEINALGAWDAEKWRKTLDTKETGAWVK
jgi:rhamnose utilization protein RhaD (predicted bifunctional aldolase and dehydrogenase)